MLSSALIVICEHSREQEVPALWGGFGDSRRDEMYRSCGGLRGWKEEETLCHYSRNESQGYRYRPVGNSTLLLPLFTKLLTYVYFLMFQLENLTWD